jgi:hypothetical protein
MRWSVENIDKRYARTLRREMRDKGRADAGRPAGDEHNAIAQARIDRIVRLHALSFPR